jgi:hypothetical protein
MLRDTDAVTMLAVKDLSTAARFYEETLRREGDVHVAGDMKVAWFKDPDGNILSVASR